ncbi:c-type cytochrome biogenesis protein CcsB [soil metagenome]
MTLADYANFSNNAIAAATIVMAVAFFAHMAEWGFARQIKTVDRELELVESSGAAVAGLDEDEDITTIRTNMFGRVGVALTVVGWLVLWAGVITRALASERVPWGNMYEFGTTGIGIALTIYLLLVWRIGIAWLGGIVTGFAVIVLGLSMTVYVPAGPTVPALHSYWLVIHVISVMIAGSLFLVGAGVSALYLVKARAEERGSVGGLLDRFPSSAAMDQLAYRVHAFAFPLWTFGALIAGPIWAQYAWGRYWGWDPKEVWAFITWVVYAGYLHARATAGWRGKRAAYIALVGFGTFLANYIIINLVVPGLHSYAK